MESPTLHTPYDEVLYPGYPFPQTHPNRLGSLARLFGMNPRAVEKCRVLELGCGDGGNLIPMAYTLRDSQFVGVDLGRRGIARGQETARALGLSNINLQCLDILDAELGRFDYIVAHGVYSWVPPAVQERILSICSENLNPHGVAYVSYAVYPGAHVRTMVAEMLQYHARRFESPPEKIEQATALLAFLSASRPGDDAYSLLLRQEMANLASRRPESLFHDELAEFQSPVYFREFVERASRHGLKYLGEADLFEMLDSTESADVSAVLRKLARDPIEKEQYLDFLKCRRFRQTLLCHAQVQAKRGLESEQMRQFYISAARHRGRHGGPVQLPSDHPVATALMAVLNEASPAPLSFDELLTRTGRGDDRLLCDLVLAFLACGHLQLHLYRPQFATTVSERPRASALARLQAAAEPFVTSLCHTTVHLEDELSVRLLRALDGTRNRGELLAEMRPAAGTGVEEELDRSLQGLMKLALLEA